MDKDEALKMAIKELKKLADDLDEKLWKKINKFEEALEQPAQEKELIAIIESLQKHIKELKFEGATIEQPAQEPVAWIKEVELGGIASYKEMGFEGWETNLGILKPEPDDIPLYTHPHQWQELTDDEISKAYNKFYDDYESDNIGIGDFMLIYFSIEQALKEKNHGS